MASKVHKAGIDSIRDLQARIRKFPTTVAHDVAQRSAPVITGLTQAAFGGGRTVYGDARPEGVNGNRLSLERTGAVKRQLGFRATGTQVRCVLGPKYARYLIGKYAILPIHALPADWSRRLREITSEVVPP